MSPSPSPSVAAGEHQRAPRADAARNRVRIVEAAHSVFAERGLDASTADIAARAGVGEATVFRHFPTKDALIAAIVEHQFEALIALAERCLADRGPWRGVERFLRGIVDLRRHDRGALEGAKDRCVAAAALEPQRRRLLELMDELVVRAQRAGVVRRDLRGADLALLATAASSVCDLPFEGLRDDLWRRYLGVILDGIRPHGASELRPGPPSRRRLARGGLRAPDARRPGGGRPGAAS